MTKAVQSTRINAARAWKGRLFAICFILSIVGCSRSLPTASTADVTPGITPVDSTNEAGVQRNGADRYALTYKGFTYPQCTYTAALAFDTYPQSKPGFPTPGQNWRGNATDWDVNAFNAGWQVWWGTPNVGLLSVRLRLAGAILVWGAVPSNPAGHVGTIQSCDASGAWVRESNWPLNSGDHVTYLPWSSVFVRGSYRLKGFILRDRR